MIYLFLRLAEIHLFSTHKQIDLCTSRSGRVSLAQDSPGTYSLTQHQIQTLTEACLGLTGPGCLAQAFPPHSLSHGPTSDRRGLLASTPTVPRASLPCGPSARTALPASSRGSFPGASAHDTPSGRRHRHSWPISSFLLWSAGYMLPVSPLENLGPGQLSMSRAASPVPFL